MSCVLELSKVRGRANQQIGWAIWMVLALTAVALSCVVGVSAACAQSAASAYTSGTRYDLQHRVVGTIAPDPDGNGALKYAAVRNSYDAAGRLIKVEKGELSSWKAETVAPSAWGAAFTMLKTIDTVYDGLDRKLTETVTGSDGAKTLTQYSYDPVGRLECTAVRMNAAVYASLPASACSLSTQGTNGPDRITRNVYDDAGQLTQTREGVGTPVEAAEATYSYTDNGKKDYVIDGEGGRAELVYDGHDRLSRWNFPSPTRAAAYNDSTPASALSSAGSVNTADYEEYLYDADGNRTSLRRRDGRTLTFAYDNLDRVKSKLVPNGCPPIQPTGTGCPAAAATRDVYYTYDAWGRQLTAKFDSISGADGVTNSYTGFGEQASSTLTMGTFSKTLTALYDADSNRTRLTHDDGQAFTYAYDGLDRLSGLYQGTGTTTSLDQFVYDNAALLATATEGAGSSITWGYDGADRLTSQAHGFVGSTGNITIGLSYNPASQIAQEARNNDDYAYDGLVNVTGNYVANGLNQYASYASASGTTPFTYDANGNLTSDGANSYIYDGENRLVSATAGGAATNLTYDPVGRLFQTDKGNNATTTRFLYDGDALVAEYNSSNSITDRYVHGSNSAADDPLVGYVNSGTNNKQWLHADHRGSIIAVTTSNGGNPSINSYDEYGLPGSNNTGRFQYTGQAWIDEIGMYYYKARIYSPRLGRFLQTDPIGYADQINLYAYVADDPVNHSDPTGAVIQVHGTPAEVLLLKKLIYKVARSNPGSNHRFNHLVESGQTHVVQFTHGELSGTLPVGRSSTISVELHPEPGRDGPFTPETIIAHELLGHAYDIDRGKSDDFSRDPKTGVKNGEESAVKAENEYRKATGMDQRTTYDGMKVQDVGERPVPPKPICTGHIIPGVCG